MLGRSTDPYDQKAGLVRPHRWVSFSPVASLISKYSRSHLSPPPLPSFRSSRSSDARLVALLPQLEERDIFNVRLSPEGMHLFRLPFMDDIRCALPSRCTLPPSLHCSPQGSHCVPHILPPALHLFHMHSPCPHQVPRKGGVGGGRQGRPLAKWEAGTEWERICRGPGRCIWGHPLTHPPTLCRSPMRDQNRWIWRLQ